mmetsp:Transcript_19838/g.43056  ORF Transcript_19838/g.43056 Transcript_19838/m.43056 type:complete len:210 (-) Transcript_19838:190-819(-)
MLTPPAVSPLQRMKCDVDCSSANEAKTYPFDVLLRRIERWFTYCETGNVEIATFDSVSFSIDLAKVPSLKTRVVGSNGRTTPSTVLEKTPFLFLKSISYFVLVLPASLKLSPTDRCFNSISIKESIKCKFGILRYSAESYTPPLHKTLSDAANQRRSMLCSNISFSASIFCCRKLAAVFESSLLFSEAKQRSTVSFFHFSYSRANSIPR